MSETEPTPPRRPFQFSLMSLLLAMVLVSVLAAALGGMLRDRPVGVRLPPGFYVIMAVAAPMGVLILVSLLRVATRWFNRRR